jgi:multidrug efflux system membrane fusion protein
MDPDVEPPKRSAWMPRVGLLVGSGAAILAVGMVWARGGPDVSPSGQPPPGPVPVRTAIVSLQPVELTSKGLGTVVAWNAAMITPQVSGQIVELPFREGGTVQTGQILARLDPRPFQAVLDQAKARKAQDEANLAAAEKNLARDQTLLAKGGFATQQTVDNERAQVDADKATTAGDQAAIESAQLNLDFTTIKAPFAGVVGLRNVDVGNIVTPSSTIVSLTQIEPIAVDFSLPQTALASVQRAAADGKPLVRVFDQDGMSLLAEGALEVINNQVDPTTGTIKLKARFDNRDHKLWPGVFVQVQLVTTTEQNAIALPSEAVQRGPDGPYVWLISPDQTARLQPVQIAAIQNDRTVIAGGISGGDRVVVSGQYRLTQGTRVTEAQPSPPVQAQGRNS